MASALIAWENGVRFRPAKTKLDLQRMFGPPAGGGSWAAGNRAAGDGEDGGKGAARYRKVE